MKTSFTCSYIIPYIHSIENLKLLRITLNILNRDPRIQKIVIETGEVSVLKHIDLKSEYKFIESDVWNVGWLYNCGTKIATTNHLIFGTFEYLPNIDIIYNIVNKKDDRPCVYLQDELIQLSEEQTRVGVIDYNMKGLKTPSHGIVYYTREGFHRVGGWDENVFGEDLYTIQDRRNASLLNIGQVNDMKTIKYNVDLPTIDNNIREYSKAYTNRILELDKEKVISYSEGQLKRICNYNKYSKISIMEV